MSRVKFPLFAGVTLALAALGSCSGAGDEATPPALSLSEWCTTLNQSLPALSFLNPDGQELEILDLHIDKYELLERGGSEVPSSATSAMGQYAVALREVRDRGAAGEPLPDVLQEALSNQDSQLMVGMTLAQSEADAACIDEAVETG